MNTDSQHIDCACLIHSTGYDWTYVEKLHRMLQNNSDKQVRLHVYTESSRTVPSSMIKHALTEWPGVGGPKKSWWYKMQLFNAEHHQGPLLYFDLDVAIVRNIDWIWEQNTEYFWTIRDFRHLWRPTWVGMNSSVMYWDTRKWAKIWEVFKGLDLRTVLRRHHGDQDYLNTVISEEKRRFLDSEKIRSWRWQIKDGGMNMNTRTYHRPDAGSVLDPKTCVMIFHGNPKPHQIDDPIIRRFWKDVTL